MADAPAPAQSWPAFARQVIESAVRGTGTTLVPTPALDAPSFAGVFVTLKKSGRLRGCIGTLDDSLAPADAIRDAAEGAALRDARFSPVAADELRAISVEVSILANPRPMGSLDNLQLGTHGIIVQKGAQRGIFLPQVAVEHHFDKPTFLSRCCSEKAGLPPDAWRNPDTEVLIFTADVYSE